MGFEWFRQRTYRHLDLPVGVPFLKKAMNPAYVATHSFSPLILRPDKQLRYKPRLHKTTVKTRPIMYVSHRDAAIFSWYSSMLSERLEVAYRANHLSEKVVAYRSLGKANFHFASDAYQFACSHIPCVIMAFDVTGFFDNLSHSRLRRRLKEILAVTELSTDWFAVLQASTNFSFIELEVLKNHPGLKDRFDNSVSGRIATVRELKDLGISFKTNLKHLRPASKALGKGIPQGTPPATVLSNVYMFEFDKALSSLSEKNGAFYRRYSDDILIICRSDQKAMFQYEVDRLISIEQLELSKAKTEVTHFTAASRSSDKVAQYLGFSMYPEGVGIRPGSLSRAWRKMRAAVNSAEVQASKSGKPLRTKGLQKRFSPVYDAENRRYLRSFPSYAIRSASIFGSNQKISKQLRKLNAGLQREIAGARKRLR